MKKRTKSTITAGIVGTVSYVLLHQENRRKIKEMGSQLISKIKGNRKKKIPKKVGHPSPYDTHDNTMVSEGSLYAIKKYNEQQQNKNGKVLS
ncbi:hypothetical protein [Bacillus alkalicellulosilyticus]|uniref:hypothetical protein n=1 Tax=Alkalihalobacterium alkalicellulosilyticum TaxID=1912214 RepID=UPI0009965E4A|nr:hypothetical protein [Bacillus alkalicellulosilyticus]